MTFRIKNLSVAGFRGFGRSIALDLDGDVVVVSGVNGSGKTSLMDSILWVLAGSIARLGKEDEIVSRYSSTGEARVEIILEGRGGSTMRVVRRHDGSSESLAVQIDGSEPFRGPSAEGQLLQALWPDALLAKDPWEALARSLTRAVYLQQDAVREFVAADGEEGRFRAVGEIVGAGRATELSSQLASARNRWSRSSTALEQEAGPRRARLADLVARASAHDEVDIDVEQLDDSWESWLRRSVDFLGEVPESSDRARHLDRTLGALRTEEARLQRLADSLEELRAALASPVPEPEGLEDRNRELEHTRAAVAEAGTRLEAARAAAARERRRLLEEAEVAEQLAAMASIALDHLDGDCPVCGQAHDQTATSERLNAYVDAPGSSDEVSSSLDSVATTAADVQQLEQAERRLAETVRSLQDQNTHRTRWLAQVSRISEELGLPGYQELTLALVGERLDLTSNHIAELSSLRSAGEQLGLSLARLDERNQRTAFNSQIQELEAEVARLDAELAARAETSEVATQLLEGLRTASEELVKAELSAMEPLLQRIYSSVDPHPSFKAVNFLTRTVGGKGRLWTPVADVDAAQSVNEPSSILSSSQLNVLAVSTFLALNLSVDSLPLEVVALDDPLQSLDDVNLLGLADLIRRIRRRRQVIVSTHDDRLSTLLSRKLRPVRAGERTLSVNLGGWTRSGPTVEVGEVPADVASLRLVG